MKDKNKGKIRQNYLKLAALSLIMLVGAIFLARNDYMSYRDFNVVVDAKEMIPGSYKSSGYPVISYWAPEQAIKFDQRVTVGTYSGSSIGDKHVINIRPFDMKQTPMQNLLYFFLPVLLGSIGFFSGVACVIGFISSSPKKPT